MMTRNINIDVIKFIAMSFVVGMHSRMHYLEYPTYDIAYYVFNSIFTPAIPLFYMVSGYLLLGRQNSDYSYSLKKIYGILRFTTIITLLFSLATFIIKCEFDIKHLIVTVCMWPIQGGDMGIFWYFAAMIVIYLCYPILNKIFIQKRIKLVLIFGLIVSFAVSYLNLFTTSWGGVEMNVPQCLRLWIIITYFILGGCLKEMNPKRITWLLYPIFLLLMTVLQLITEPYTGKVCLELYYSNPITIAYCCYIFLLLLNLPRFKNKDIGNTLSRLFLPVYTFHFIILLHSGYLAKCFNCLGWFSPFAYLALIYIIIIMFCLLIIMIPYMDKLFKI